MIASTSCGLNTKIGMSGWPETMPSASDSARSSTGIFAGEGAERRCVGVGAIALLADGVAARAILPDKDLALCGQVLLDRPGQRCPKQKEQESGDARQNPPPPINLSSGRHALVPLWSLTTRRT